MASSVATAPAEIVRLGIRHDDSIVWQSWTAEPGLTQRHSVTIYAPDGTVQDSCLVRLPPSAPSWRSALVCLTPVVPPAVALAGLRYPSILMLFLVPAKSPWFAFVARTWVMLCVGTGLLCVPILWLMSLRDGASTWSRVGWAAFGLGFSIVGILTYLGLRSRPVREPCASCGRKRLVDVPLCPSCASPFPEPELTGTEVFDYAR